MTATARRANYEDVCNAPPTLVAELIFGTLYTRPRPSLRHANAASHLGILLGGPYRFGIGGPGGWVIYDEPELHLGTEPDVLVPDLAGWRRKRLAELLAWVTRCGRGLRCFVTRPACGRNPLRDLSWRWGYFGSAKSAIVMRDSSINSSGGLDNSEIEYRASGST